MVEAHANKMKYSVFLPPEMVEKILGLLTYKELCQAKLICKRWKGIIENGNLVEKALGKIFKPSTGRGVKIFTNSLIKQ